MTNPTPSSAFKALVSHATNRPGTYAFAVAVVALLIGWGLDANTFFSLTLAQQGMVATVIGFAYQQWQIREGRKELRELNGWVRSTLAETIANNTACIRDFRIVQDETSAELRELQQAVSRINGEPHPLPNPHGSALESKYGVDGDADTRTLTHA